MKNIGGILKLMCAAGCALSVAGCAGDPVARQPKGASTAYPPRFLVSVEERRGGAVAERFGFIDATGKVVIPIKFEYAYDFSEGLAHVFVGGRHAFIDTAGTVRFYLPDDCMEAHRFSEGLALVNLGGEANYHYMNGGRWGFVDREGRLAISARFELRVASIDWTDRAASFSEGLAAMPGPGGRFGFIDHTGSWVIPPKFDTVLLPFRNGLAEVEVNTDASGDSTVGWIDRTGRFVWKSEPVTP